MVAWLFALFVLVGCTSSRSEGARPAEPASAEIDLTAPESERAAAPAFGGLCLDEPSESDSCHDASEGRPDPQDTGAEVAPTVWDVPVRPDDPVRGPRAALVTMVVFSDFQCPFCKQAASVFERLLEKHPRELRQIWKDVPLPGHQWAERAAQFARAVRAEQGDAGFWKAHDLLFERQPKFDDEVLRAIAAEIGSLDYDGIRAAIRERRFGLPIYESLKLADRVEVTQVPTTFINGRKIAALRSFELYDTVVREELEKARRLLESGTPRARVYATIIANGKQAEPVTDAPVVE